MSIGTLIPKKGEISFVWFNPYSGVTIRTPTKTLVIDPADIDPKIFKTVDAVLITHEHGDHLDVPVVKSIHNRTQCLVIADLTSAGRLKGTVTADKLPEVRVGSEIRLNDVIVKVESCKHPAANPVTFLITSEDGVRVYHTADSLPFSEMKRIGEKHPPDIVFCTVGRPAPGASPKTGVEIVKMVKPKVAIPYHAPAAERNRFAKLLSREAPQVRCIVVEPGEPYKYP